MWFSLPLKQGLKVLLREHKKVIELSSLSVWYTWLHVEFGLNKRNRWEYSSYQIIRKGLYLTHTYEDTHDFTCPKKIILNFVKTKIWQILNIFERNANNHSLVGPIWNRKP